jgi:hypothetical protein
MISSWQNWTSTMFDFTPVANLPGYHYICNNYTGKYLTPDETGGLVVEQSFSGAQAQQWKILVSNIDPGFYYIRNRSSGKQMFSDATALLKVRTPQSSIDERWQLNLSNVVRLKNKASGKYLSGIDSFGGQAGGNYATVKSVDGTIAQLWQKVYYNTTEFYLKNVQTGLLLWGKDVYGQSDSGCAVSCQYDFQWSSERWKIIDTGDGCFAIKNMYSARYLSADDTSEGALAVSSDQSLVNLSKWTFENVIDHL